MCFQTDCHVAGVYHKITSGGFSHATRSDASTHAVPREALGVHLPFHNLPDIVQAKITALSQPA